MSNIKITFPPKLEIYKDSVNEWRWKIKVSGNIISVSTEGYKNRKDCIENILKVEKRIKYLRENELIK